MSTAQKRNYALDNIRAIAIIVVVLGHSIILYSSDWGAYNSAVYYPFLDYLKKFINLFQMPLFFSLSGYLFIQQYQKKSYLHLISNKSIRLLVPYISVALLWMIPIKLIVSYPGYDGKNFADIFLKGILLCQDNGHLWYLPCLFIIFLISKLLFSLRTKLISHNTKLKAKSEWIDILFLLIPVAFLFLSFKMPVPLFKNVLKYYIWFYWGGILFAYREQIKKLKTKFVMAFLILLLIGGVFLALSCSSKLISEAVSLIIVTCFYIFIPDRECKTLGFISQYSFGIYLLHSPLIYITFTYLKDENPLIVIGLNFLVFGAVSLLLSIGISKTPLKILIGMKYTVKKDFSK